MKGILANNFDKELIIYAVRPDLGHVALNCNTIRKCINLGKKVLFYCLETPKELMLKRIGIEETSNLLVMDSPINNIEDISSNIDNFKPDIVIIDYFLLLNRTVKCEDIVILNELAKQHNIPFIVVQHISNVTNKEVDFSTITLEEFKKVNSKALPLIDNSDRFIVFYQKGPKEYMLRELKNIYGETKEVDIRELLN